jgi:hypothetical protein
MAMADDDDEMRDARVCARERWPRVGASAIAIAIASAMVMGASYI